MLSKLMELKKKTDEQFVENIIRDFKDKFFIKIDNVIHPVNGEDTIWDVEDWLRERLSR